VGEMSASCQICIVKASDLRQTAAVLTTNLILGYNMNKKAQLTQREARDSLGI